MANDSDLLVQENIDEYINEENRIVTCKWLSLTLKLNINAAKQALYTFVEHSRKKTSSSSINVTYFVAGLGKSKSGDLEHKCVVVPESDLGTVKQSLSVVTSCHLYSVQAAKLKDYTPLYQTDYDIIKQNLDHCSSQSSISCGWVAHKAVRQPGRTADKPNSIQKPEKNESTPTAASSTSGNTASSCAVKATKKAEPKGSIASMFAATGQKKGGDIAPAGQKRGLDVVVTSAPSKAKPSQKKSGVAAFFNSNGVNNKTSPENNKSTAVTKTQDKKLTEKTNETEEADDEPDRKRRRRIRTDLFDSSEDEDEEEYENAALAEDIKPEIMERNTESPLLLSTGNNNDDGGDDTPINDDREEENVKPLNNVENVEPPRNTLNSEGRKRKRAMKTVTKQYQDADGFMVTKKESIWESESDDSEPEEVVVVEEEKAKLSSAPVKQINKTPANHKVEPKRKTAAKKTSPQKGKQTSLMSFFQKR